MVPVLPVIPPYITMLENYSSKVRGSSSVYAVISRSALLP